MEDPILYERLSLSEVPELEDEYSEKLKKSSELLQLPNWKQLAAQSCKIPNNQLFESDIFGNGCFYVAFSNNGKYLACVGSEDDNHPIFVYSASNVAVLLRNRNYTQLKKINKKSSYPLLFAFST